MIKKVLTLCIIHQHPRVLLGMKKKGFGQGRWNGFGGKVEEGETVENAAQREVFEEAGVTVTDMSYAGVIEFMFQGENDILEVHVFRANAFTGTPVESDEMQPQWFHVDEIPFDAMWPDDRHWLPLLLAGKQFSGKFLFEGQTRILKYTLQEVNGF